MKDELTSIVRARGTGIEVLRERERRVRERTRVGCG